MSKPQWAISPSVMPVNRQNPNSPAAFPLRSVRSNRNAPNADRALRVSQFSDGDADRWRNYVGRRHDATLFHELPWKRAVERAFGHRSRYLLASRGDAVVGILPLFEVQSVLAGRLLVSVPYGTYGGPLAEDRTVCTALLEAATSIGIAVGARSMEFRSLRACFDSMNTVRTHATFTKSMPSTPEQVAEMFPRKARAAARRCHEKYHPAVEFDDRNLNVVWHLYARSMRRLSSPNYPYRFFEELVRATPGEHVVQLVRHEGRPVAGLVTFLYRDRIMPYFVGFDERENLYGLSQFLYLQSMEWGVRHGFRTYDFGRTRLNNPGPLNFKRFCGFEPTILAYQSGALPGRSAPDLAPGSPRWAAARRIWKTLPLSITRPLGGWLTKSIPG